MAGERIKWDSTHNAHPFWAINRQKTDEDKEKCNCELKVHGTTVVATTPKGIGWADPCTLTWQVRIPYIVNNKPIAKGETIMLSWHVVKKDKKEKKDTTWADDVQKEERKRKRGR